jgi:hypothetical protein
MQDEVAKLESGDNEEPFQPDKIPWWLRDGFYYAGVATSMAILIWPEFPLLVRIAGAISLGSNTIAKVYRARKQ